MNGLEQIMYGVTDFARMRAENAHFVDRTDLIREVDKRLDRVQESFDEHCRPVIDQFARHYAPRLPEGVSGIDPRIFDIYVAHGPYLVPHEGECGRGFVDIALKPQLSRYPEIGYACDKDIAREWNLKPIPNVTDGVPGGEVVVCEEI